MSWDQLVMRNVYQEIVLEEALDFGEVFHAGEGLAGCWGQGDVGDHDAGFVVVGDGVFGELTDLTDTELLVGEEFDPDGAAVGDGIGVGFGCGRRVLLEHGVAGTSGELKLGAADLGTFVSL